MTQHKTKKGFSFLEVMIATFVLGIGMVAIIELFSKNLSGSIQNRNRVIATGLAQEGVELVRNIRDTNVISGAGVFDNIPQAAAGCRMGVDEATPDCSPSSFDLLYDGTFYLHTTGSSTPFQRRISFAGDATQRIVTSMVVWGGGTFPLLTDCTAINKCSAAEAVFTNWR